MAEGTGIQTKDGSLLSNFLYVFHDHLSSLGRKHVQHQTKLKQLYFL